MDDVEDCKKVFTTGGQGDEEHCKDDVEDFKDIGGEESGERQHSNNIIGMELFVWNSNAAEFSPILEIEDVYALVGVRCLCGRAWPM